jgi:hypothetical protein
MSARTAEKIFEQNKSIPRCSDSEVVFVYSHFLKKIEPNKEYFHHGLSHTRSPVDYLYMVTMIT